MLSAIAVLALIFTSSCGVFEQNGGKPKCEHEWEEIDNILLMLEDGYYEVYEIIDIFGNKYEDINSLTASTAYYISFREKSR